MADEPAAQDREPKPTSGDVERPLSNAELTREISILKRQNIDMYNQVQNLLSRMAKLDRDVRSALSRRH